MADESDISSAAVEIDIDQIENEINNDQDDEITFENADWREDFNKLEKALDTDSLDQIDPNQGHYRGQNMTVRSILSSFFFIKIFVLNFANDP